MNTQTILAIQILRELARAAEPLTIQQLADRLGLFLEEAARFVVPVSVSAREKIQALRQEASGRYLSASTPGVYHYAATKQTAAARNMNLD